jgi:hypothetical protein
MGIYIPTNSKIGSFISIACLVEVFSPDILIYFVIYLLNAMKGVRRGICIFGKRNGRTLHRPHNLSKCDLWAYPGRRFRVQAKWDD